MDKSTLIIIADILQNIDRSNRGLYDLIENLNLTSEEKQKIIDSIMVIEEKLEWIRRSKINELDRHIDIEHVKNINRF